MLLFRLTFSIYSFCFISVWCRLLFALFLTLLTTSFVGYSSCVCLQSCVRVLMPFVLEIIFIFPQFLDAVFFLLFICRLWVWFCVCVCVCCYAPHHTQSLISLPSLHSILTHSMCVCVYHCCCCWLFSALPSIFPWNCISMIITNAYTAPEWEKHAKDDDEPIFADLFSQLLLLLVLLEHSGQMM